MTDKIMGTVAFIDGRLISVRYDAPQRVMIKGMRRIVYGGQVLVHGNYGIAKGDRVICSVQRISSHCDDPLSEIFSLSSGEMDR